MPCLDSRFPQKHTFEESQDLACQACGFVQGLEGRMATAFKLVCKHYELSEEIVEKLLLEETMLREMAEHGTVLSADAGGRHTRRKARRKHGKKNTPEQNVRDPDLWMAWHTCAGISGSGIARSLHLRVLPLAAIALQAAGSEGIKQASKKKKKKRRRRKKHERMLLGQEGIDALRGRSQSDGIIIGCHEYNACEVKTLAVSWPSIPPWYVYRTCNTPRAMQPGGCCVR